MEVDPHLLTLLLQLTDGEYHVHGAAMTAEAALSFRQEALFRMVFQGVKVDESEELPSDFQRRDVSMIVAELEVLFPLVEVDDCGILEILRDFSLTPHLLEERRQRIHALGATVHVNLSRYRVRSGRFPAGELLHDPDGFVERRREVAVGVVLHLRQTGDESVGDGGETVEDASEALRLSLRNLCLLSEKGGPVSGFVGCGTVYSLDRGEVLSFVAVRVPFDLLGLASRSGVLHFPQSLFHKTTITVEGYFVVVGGAVNVGFVQAVLGKQVADGGVIVVEQVLMLGSARSRAVRTVVWIVSLSWHHQVPSEASSSSSSSSSAAAAAATAEAATGRLAS
ncbi:hypothetical protein SprV_0100144700 [Sparganum proliferum]